MKSGDEDSDDARWLRQRRKQKLNFRTLEEFLEDAHDLRIIERRRHEPTIPLADVKRRLRC